MNFEDWLLKEKECNEYTFQDTWNKILRDVKDSTNMSFKILYRYAEFTMIFPNKMSQRERRKLIAKHRYLEIKEKSPKMKRSTCVNMIADELHVKKDCVRVYLRETGL